MMKIFSRRKSTATKKVQVREVVLDDRALKKAARESIKDQKKVHKQATRLRAQAAR